MTKADACKPVPQNFDVFEMYCSFLTLTGLVVVSVKMVHGELEQATKENPLLLKNVCVTKKLGFSDVIMPGDVRYVAGNTFACSFTHKN